MSCNDWKEVKLGEVCEIKYGKDHKKLKSGCIPVYGSGGIMRYVDKEIHNKTSVLIPRKGTLSNLFFVKPPFWTVDTLFWTDIFTQIIFPKFLYYQLCTLDLSSHNVGTAVPSLTTAVLNELPLFLPPLPEQKAIADTLSCLDDKIELNNKINKNLEAQAQAIFKSWFVDFEPFQDGEFVDSELGRIPKGWKVHTIDDVVTNSNTGGDAIQKTPMVEFDTGIKCVRVGDMTNNRYVNEWGFSNVSKENFEKYQLKKNDIIVTRTACLGLNKLIDENINAVYNNGLIRLKLSEKIIPLFFYHSINTEFYKEYIGRIESESSTRPNMKINYLLNFKFVYPPIEIQKNFRLIVEVLREDSKIIIEQSRILKNLRDALLPKLMSGEIRIPPSQSIQD